MTFVARDRASIPRFREAARAPVVPLPGSFFKADEARNEV